MPAIGMNPSGGRSTPPWFRRTGTLPRRLSRLAVLGARAPLGAAADRQRDPANDALSVVDSGFVPPVFELRMIPAVDALARLRDGNQRFVANQTTAPSSSARRGALVAGQEPFAIVLGCSDS